MSKYYEEEPSETFASTMMYMATVVLIAVIFTALGFLVSIPVAMVLGNTAAVICNGAIVLGVMLKIAK